MEPNLDFSRAFVDFLGTYGLLAIFVVMLAKEAGVPIPVPSDLIVIGAGAQAAAGTFNVLELLLLIEVAALVGCSAQFLIVRSAGRRFVHRAGRVLGLSPERLDRTGALLQGRGALGIVLGLNLPIARTAVIPAAGLAGLSVRAFAPVLLAGSVIFYGWHLALGYFAGPTATTLLENLNLPISAALVGLALLGLAAWLLLRRRANGKPLGATLNRLRWWSEAACPACLVAAAVEEMVDSGKEDLSHQHQ